MTENIRLVIVQPLPITDAMLISTDIPETDYAAWNSATTYALGDRSIRTGVHKIYESLQASNLNHTPETSPTWWIEVSPTNRWKVFDTSNSTQTVGVGASPTTITYTLAPGVPISAIALLNITNALSATITMTDPVYGVVYSQTVDLSSVPASPSWWQWFFGQRTAPGQHIALDLPSYLNAQIQIALTGLAGLALGVIMVGRGREFGVGVNFGARVGIQDFSRIETNAFGDRVFVKRAYAKRGNFELRILNSELDPLQNQVAALRATPCLWVFTNIYEATSIFGFYSQFEELIIYPTESDCQISIEGMT